MSGVNAEPLAVYLFPKDGCERDISKIVISGEIIKGRKTSSWQPAPRAKLALVRVGVRIARSNAASRKMAGAQGCLSTDLI